MAGIGVLPVSGTKVLLHEPTGDDELLVLEGTGSSVTTLVALAESMASDLEGGVIDWPALPATELGAIALLIRGIWLGDTIRTAALCSDVACDQRIDVSFNIPEYLDHHRGRRFRGLIECEPGWFTFANTDVRFRIPTIADLFDALTSQHPETIDARCIQPANPSKSLANRIDRALDALAPRLDGELIGDCPSCGRNVALHFEPTTYVLEELRDASGGLFGQVHELASSYHWSEQAILALGRRRRHNYVAMIRSELVVG